MSLPVTRQRALVLRIAPTGESFQKIEILTRETGYILCLKRISKKAPSPTPPDLFDSADIILQSPRQGAARFINDYQLEKRRSSIGQSYRKLQCASEFCSFMAQNAPHMAEPALLYEITERTLDAFTEKKSPEVVALKALYLLLKDEGYPVREFWWPQLPEYLRETTKRLINEPSPENVSEEQLETCLKITQNLRNWLTLETDLTLP